jgi:3-hydroxybutyryl-CoA dehydratase
MTTSGAKAEGGRLLPAGRFGFSDVAQGDVVETGAVMVTAEMIDQFAGMTGDRFEIHMSDEAAQRHGFRERVAHGLLVLSLIDGLKNQAAAQFQAQASLGWDWSFQAPVLAGDTISATMTVISIKPVSAGDRAVVTLGFDVKNQSGVTVQQGTNRLMVYA